MEVKSESLAFYYRSRSRRISFALPTFRSEACPRGTSALAVRRQQPLGCSMCMVGSREALGTKTKHKTCLGIIASIVTHVIVITYLNAPLLVHQFLLLVIYLGMQKKTSLQV